MQYRIKPTLEMIQRARTWLEQPLPDDEDSLAQLLAELDDIVTGQREAAE